MSAIASFSTVAVAAPTTASRSNVAKRYVCIFIRRETNDRYVATPPGTSVGVRIGKRSIDRPVAGFLPFGWICDGS